MSVQLPLEWLSSFVGIRTPAVDLGRGPWMARAEVNLVGRAKLGENDNFQAGGYSLLNLSLEYKRANQVWSVRGSNLTNRLAYNATAVDEIREFTPLAGRALQAGVRWYF